MHVHASTTHTQALGKTIIKVIFLSKPTVKYIFCRKEKVVFGWNLMLFGYLHLFLFSRWMHIICVAMETLMDSGWCCLTQMANNRYNN